MPLFKIQSSSVKDKYFIKADNISDIIEQGKKKFKLPENINYKVILIIILFVMKIT